LDSDEQRRLVEAARGRDAKAWECLYRDVYPRLRAYVARRAGLDVADDLVSETMTRAVAGIHRFRWESAGFDGWLFGIARRVTADHLRRLATGRRRPLGQDMRALEVDPGEGLERADEHAEIRRLFAQLTPAERELLELRVIGRLSAEQTAAVLGKRAGAVRTAQSRALAHLRQLLGDER
jgi:RNA polymerase sigma-70 factor (ECF subfamily)